MARSLSAIGPATYSKPSVATQWLSCLWPPLVTARAKRTDIFSKTDEDAFSRVLLGTYCVILARLSKGTLVTTAVLMEHDPSHLNTVSRRASKLVELGLLERHKAINDNKRYEIAFKVPDGLVEKLRRSRRG